MKEVHYVILLAILVQINGSFLDLNEVKNSILQLKNISFSNINEVGAISDGLFDLSEIKNKLLEWKTQKLAALCPSNAIQLQNLLNVVCSTAQPINTTSRDACISCFSKLTTAPQGPQELNGLSVCATRYFSGSTYAGCAENLQILASSALNVQTAGCYMGYCDFIKCLRRVNSQNLVIECTREARTGINIMMDADNLRFYTNVTSCILAKSRCGNFNPITGAPQIPGFMGNNIRVTNALQITAAGDLRVIAFSGNTKVAATFCTTSTNLTQTSWLTNIC